MTSTLAQIAMILTVAAPLQAAPTTQPATKADIAKLQDKIEAKADKLATQDTLTEVKTKLEAHDNSNSRFWHLVLGGIIAAVTGIVAAYANHRYQSTRDDNKHAAELDRDKAKRRDDLIRERQTLIGDLVATCSIMVASGAQSAQYKAELHVYETAIDNTINNKTTPINQDVATKKESFNMLIRQTEILRDNESVHNQQFNATNAEQARTLASIRHAFDVNEELRALIDAVLKSVRPTVDFRGAPVGDEHKLHLWTREQIGRKLQNRMNEALRTPVDKLIAYLCEHIDDPRTV